MRGSQVTGLRGKASWGAAMAAMVVAGFSVSTALADPGNGNGPPASPPGQGECQHGNSGQECKPDPQPEHGKDCDEHGNQGGVNEDHCLPEQTTTSETTTDQTTTDRTTTSETTTTTTTQTTTQQTTTTASTTTTPPSATTTTGSPNGASPPATAQPTSTTAPGVQSAPPAHLTEPQLEKALAKQAARFAKGRSASHQARAGELPFTGFPTWIVAVMGLLMLAAGLGIRRVSTRFATHE